MANLQGCDRDCMAPKATDIYYVALYTKKVCQFLLYQKKNLQTSALCRDGEINLITALNFAFSDHPFPWQGNSKGPGMVGWVPL